MNIKFLRLPGSYNYRANISHPLYIKDIEYHLGPTFYSRMSSIYMNTLQSIANQNYSYLSSSMSSPLANYLISKRNDLKEKGYRVRISKPSKITVLSKNKKRDKIWKNQNISVSIESSVYFGMEFDHSNPLNDGKNIKVFKTGPHRFWVYNRSISIIQNFFNLFKYQTYEFKTKVVSSTHMKIFDTSNKSVYLDDEKDEFEEKGLENAEKEVETEFLMRTGSQRFDWVIVDINGIMTSRSKV